MDFDQVTVNGVNSNDAREYIKSNQYSIEKNKKYVKLYMSNIPGENVIRCKLACKRIFDSNIVSHRQT